MSLLDQVLEREGAQIERSTDQPPESAMAMRQEYNPYAHERTDKRTDRRRWHNRPKQFNLKRLWDVHREINRRIALGQNNREIANELGIHQQTVSITRNSDLAKKHVEVLRGAMDSDTIDLGIRIRDIAPKALDYLENIIKGEVKDASIGLRAHESNKMLDRAGYAPVKKFMGLHGYLSADDIERIKQRARDSNILAVQGTEDHK